MSVMSEPRISIVIVSYNTLELTRRCLQSLQRFEPDAQVIVVDNASRDGSADMVRAEFPQVVCVVLPENLGFAGGNNQGIAHATGDFVVLLNSDTEIAGDVLSACARWMQQHPRVGAASPRLMGVDGVPQECRFAMPSLPSEMAKALGRPARPLQGDHDPRGWLAGTALVIRRQALEAAGGRLDDVYFMYFEDMDFSARLQAAGWERAVFSEGQVLHHGGASGGGADARRRADLEAWLLFGRYHWFRRHRGWAQTTGLWLLDWTSVARYLARGLLRPQRRSEIAYGGVMARALIRALGGQAPPRPGVRKVAK
jgi:GT2 family glycosyltransferase